MSLPIDLPESLDAAVELLGMPKEAIFPAAGTLIGQAPNLRSQQPSTPLPPLLNGMSSQPAMPPLMRGITGDALRNQPRQVGSGLQRTMPKPYPPLTPAKQSMAKSANIGNTLRGWWDSGRNWASNQVSNIADDAQRRAIMNHLVANNGEYTPLGAGLIGAGVGGLGGLTIGALEGNRRKRPISGALTGGLMGGLTGGLLGAGYKTLTQKALEPAVRPNSPFASALGAVNHNNSPVLQRILTNLGVSPETASNLIQSSRGPVLAGAAGVAGTTGLTAAADLGWGAWRRRLNNPELWRAIARDPSIFGRLGVDGKPIAGLSNWASDRANAGFSNTARHRLLSGVDRLQNTNDVARLTQELAAHNNQRAPSMAGWPGQTAVQSSINRTQSALSAAQTEAAIGNANNLRGGLRNARDAVRPWSSGFGATSLPRRYPYLAAPVLGGLVAAGSSLSGRQDPFERYRSEFMRGRNSPNAAPEFSRARGESTDPAYAADLERLDLSNPTNRNFVDEFDARAAWTRNLRALQQSDPALARQVIEQSGGNNVPETIWSRINNVLNLSPTRVNRWW